MVVVSDIGYVFGNQRRGTRSSNVAGAVCARYHIISHSRQL